MYNVYAPAFLWFNFLSQKDNYSMFMQYQAGLSFCFI